MGLFKGTHKAYYTGNDKGNYQFTSLEDVITQFEIAYVGENKIIPKINRADIAFHAQRALQELSFDTFKSIKSQQIDLPPTLKMILPHDYVNYTKISWTDSSGIKHPLYKTNSTSNPFHIRQVDNGNYDFPTRDEMLVNNDFGVSADASSADGWTFSAERQTFGANYGDSIGIISNKLSFGYTTTTTSTGGHVSMAYQAVDVSNINYLEISADGVVRPITYTQGAMSNGTATATVRFGISSTIPDDSDYSAVSGVLGSTSIFDVLTTDGSASYLEWSGTEDSTKTLENIDVRNIDTVYAVALSFPELTAILQNGFALLPTSVWSPGTSVVNDGAAITTANINSLDNLSITNDRASNFLQTKAGNEENSSTWNNYKSITPSENNNDDYDDDTYWPDEGSRFGLEPSHAQINGSFYIDNILGNIHFSSNISGKTVILDYISDSLGTDAEMQVHKFAEEAMYRWIAHAILSTSSYGQPLVPRLTKEKFAAIRKAKLRLSNIKIEELTQILRGKSKQIKH